MGRASRRQASLNRERVVEAAARLFRERGLNGLGIAELMAEAGLTHGGFYRQFGSKEAVAGEACCYAMEKSVAGWKEVAGAQPADEGRLAAIVDHYLARNADGPRCAIAALAGEVAREAAGSPVRAAFTGGVRTLAEVLASAMPDGADRRERSLALLATLAGAVALARAVDDPELSQALLGAVRKSAG